MLELKNLTVKRGDLTVADHINVRFEEGKVYTVCLLYTSDAADE